jgi:AcrR family transcriptional regulator
VLQAAASTPIDGVSVAEICRIAGITRDTFYRHASGVVELLAEALGDEIDVLTTSLPATSAIGEGERVLLAHVRERADVYRSAMSPMLAAPVRAALERVIGVRLAEWLRERPELPPAAIAGDAQALEIAVAYAAAGTVGAIETWLRAGAEDLDRGVEVILAASAQWWLR